MQTVRHIISRLYTAHKWTVATFKYASKNCHQKYQNSFLSKNDNFNYNLIFNATVPSSSSSSYLSLILMPLFQNTFIFLSYYNLFEV